MPVDPEHILKQLVRPPRIVRSQHRRIFRHAPHIRPRDRLIEMDSPDEAAQFPVPVEHILDVPKCLRLCAERGIRVHEVSRVEHDALVFVLDAVHQPRGQLRLGHGQPALPQVFQQQRRAVRHAAHQLVEKLAYAVDHLAAGVSAAPGQRLFNSGVRRVKHDIFRAVFFCVLKVSPVVLQKRLPRLSAIHPAHVFHRIQLAQAGVHVASPEIEPVRQAVHMHAGHALLRHDPARILLKAHQLHAVKAPHQRFQRRAAFKPVEVARACRQIELYLHESSSGRRSKRRASSRTGFPSSMESLHAYPPQFAAKASK